MVKRTFATACPLLVRRGSPSWLRKEIESLNPKARRTRPEANVRDGRHRVGRLSVWRGRIRVAVQMSIESSNLGQLVGRGKEVRLLTSLLDGVEGAGAALVLRGEPGEGKSRLLSETA